MTHNLHPPGSPLSPLSPPSPLTTDQRTIYNVIYSADNPTSFYSNGHLVKTGACPHLCQLKQKIKEGKSDNLFENYRALVRYSIGWHKSRDKKRSKQVRPFFFYK